MLRIPLLARKRKAPVSKDEVVLVKDADKTSLPSQPTPGRAHRHDGGARPLPESKPRKRRHKKAKKSTNVEDDHPLSGYYAEFEADDEFDQEQQRFENPPPASGSGSTRRKRGDTPGRGASPITPDPDVKVKKVSGRTGRPRNPDPPADPPLAVNVYIETEGPPSQLLGKTSRGNKMKPGPPQLGGPFILTKEMSWDDFLDGIATTVKMPLANIIIPSFTWRWNSKPQSSRLPLTTENGFVALKNEAKQVSLAATRKSTIGHILVMMAHPVVNPHVSRYSEENQRVIASQEAVPDVSMINAKPVVNQLMEKYPPGLCPTHPTLACFHYAPNDWHFELSSPKLKVWASHILRGTATINQIPLGTPVFGASQTIPKSKTTAITPHRDQGSSSAHTPIQPYAPAPMLPAPGYYAAQMPPQMPQQYPFHQMPYGFHAPFGPPHYPPQQPYFGMQAPPPLPALFGVPDGMPARHVADSDMARSSPVPVCDVEEWCTNAGLDEAARIGLEKLEFKVGTDKLKDLDEKEWRWAGFGALAWKRVLRAELLYREASRARRAP
ncbi:hypothetical protein FA95DRAFT_1631791 [Auriscalpium vulgare]|uniref:Uncharacterized protein n=1 Tax=Auriscalpium vulgare TaxID=40419 RepID=A0ACB8RHQ9_9AGAM|nr:hypothetical protein FA95DRAFT_1631791 [Auriscalpium vulgare]